MSGPNAYLDGAMIINLERREDRHWFARGGLRVLEFNDDTIIRFIAHDALDYPDTTSILQAAIADGFPEFSEFAGVSRSYAAWFWTWRCALRRIVEIDKTVLLLIDDYILKRGWTFWRLYNLVSVCEGDPHGFRMIQLSHCYDPHAAINPRSYFGTLAKGLSGPIDVATLVHPEGAKLLLEIASMQPLGNPADDFGKLTSRGDEYGIWHTLDDICEVGFTGDNDSEIA